VEVLWMPTCTIERETMVSAMTRHKQQKHCFRIYVVIVLIACSVIFLDRAPQPTLASSTSSSTSATLDKPPTTTSAAAASATTNTVDPIDQTDTMDEEKQSEILKLSAKDDISIVFSDLDGTLIHYPTDNNNNNKSKPKSQRGNSLLKLPPSSTGMRGVISSQTLQKIKSLREDRKIKFVLVSGMRTSTFLSRLPYLPRADAYALEAGGRIFYPVTAPTSDREGTTEGDAVALQELEASGRDVFVVRPKHFDGATKEDLLPFAIEEDMQWRKNIEQLAGNFDSPPLKELAKKPSKTKDVRERDGLLWDFARMLSHEGFVLDTNGYSSCFRVNKKQQDPASVSDDSFKSLSDGRVQPIKGLASSVNLSCVDYYPASSGKRNCCLYLASKFFPESDSSIIEFVSKHAVCLCDDDNDLEMAMACRRAFIPEITSATMKAAIETYPEQFTVTASVGEGDVGNKQQRSGPEATEAALSLILDSLAAKESEEEKEEATEVAVTSEAS